MKRVLHCEPFGKNYPFANPKGTVVTPKQRAAEAAVAFVESGSTIGLGTGSTADCFVEALGQRLASGALRGVKGVATSIRTQGLAESWGIEMLTLDEAPSLDAVFDGADEIDPNGNMIKGGGGSLLREKIVAQVARKKFVLVDSTKCVERLGTTFVLPLEVIPFGGSTHLGFLESLGAKPSVRETETGRIFFTDESNLTVDLDFRPKGIADLDALEAKLQSRVGIVETGLFLGMCDVLVIGTEGEAQVHRFDEGPSEPDEV